MKIQWPSLISLFFHLQLYFYFLEVYSLSKIEVYVIMRHILWEMIIIAIINCLIDLRSWMEKLKKERKRKRKEKEKEEYEKRERNRKVEEEAKSK